MKALLNYIIYLFCIIQISSFNSFSQEISIDPKIWVSSDSISYDYSINGIVELNDSLVFVVELFDQDSIGLHNVFTYSTGQIINQNITNPTIVYDWNSAEFSIDCGDFNKPDLMLHVALFKNDELVSELYHKYIQ